MRQVRWEAGPTVQKADRGRSVLRRQHQRCYSCLERGSSERSSEGWNSRDVRSGTVSVSALDGFLPSVPGEVVSGIQANKVIIKFQKEPPCRFAKADQQGGFYIGELNEYEYRLLRCPEPAPAIGGGRCLHEYRSKTNSEESSQKPWRGCSILF